MPAGKDSFSLPVKMEGLFPHLLASSIGIHSHGLSIIAIVDKHRTKGTL